MNQETDAKESSSDINRLTSDSDTADQVRVTEANSVESKLNSDTANQSLKAAASHDEDSANHNSDVRDGAEAVKNSSSVEHDSVITGADSSALEHDTPIGDHDTETCTGAAEHDAAIGDHDSLTGTGMAKHDTAVGDHDTATHPHKKDTVGADVEAVKVDGTEREGHGVLTNIVVEDVKRKDVSADENVPLIVNGSIEGSRICHGKDKDDDDDDEGEELMVDMADDMDHRVENLTRSILDLQINAESGTDIISRQYVQKRGIAKYNKTLKTLIPVRSDSPKDVLPISSSGCLNYCTYGWVTPIIFKIYRKGVESLQSFRLSDIDSAEVNADRLERLWKEELERRGADKASFRRVVFRAFRTRLLISLFFLLLFIFFSLFNPIFLIRSFLEYMTLGKMEIGIGMVYVVSMVMCEFLRSVAVAVTWIINYQAGLRIRSGAVTLLYRKILHLKGLKDKTVGELVNLVANDSQRIFESIAVGPMLLAGPVAMASSTIYAILYLGPWALVGCIIFIGFYPFNAYISRLTTYLRRRGIVVTDKRVRMMNELLTCIKLIKMYAWEKPFAKKIADIRLTERGYLEKSAMVQSISTGTAGLVPALASTLTFVAIVSAGNDLTAAEAFSFLALLNSMRFALGVLPYAVKALSELSVAMSRYTSVLLMQEMDPDTGLKPPHNIAIEVKDANMAWSYVEDLNSDMPGSRIVPNKKKKKSGEGKASGKAEDDEKNKMLSDTAANAMMSENNSADLTTLRNITFSLEKGKLLGVCGSVGSGKSSLIQAVLGRMDRETGSITVGGRVAYVPQQAWIMNATARDNILFGAPYIEEKYNRVIEVCALQTDFDSLITGDQTEIGERGINLSGGQKQRISLARALYSDSDIYLLDDPLSAVDIHIGRHLFTNCIKGYLTGRSVIFVTHQLQYLPQCDDIFVLKDGQISEKGHHDDLMAQNGEYASLMRIYYKEHTSELAEDDEAEVHSELSASPRPTLERAFSLGSAASENMGSKTLVLIERGISVTSKISTVEVLNAKTANGPAEESEDNKNGGKLIAAEEMEKGSVGLRVFLDYCKASGSYLIAVIMFIIFILSVVAQNSSTVFLSYWLGEGSGNTTIKVGNKTMISLSVTDHPQLSTFTLIFGMTVVSMAVFLVIRSIAFMKFTLRASSRMHDDVFEKILHCPMSFFDTTPLGRIVNRFSSDMDEVDVRLPMTFEVFITNILHIIISLGLIAFVAPWFLVALLPLMIAFLFMFRLFTRTVRDLKRLDMVTRGPLVSHITATVQGLSTISAYSKTKEFYRKFCKMYNSNSIPFTMAFIANRWLALRLDMLCIVIIGVTALIIVLTYEKLTPALAGLALSSAIQMTGMFQFTVRLAIETEARFVSVQRVLSYSKKVESEGPGIIPNKRPAKDWPNNGAISFRNIKMRYRDGLPLVLKGVSFKVSPQEKIGIVGRTGSGKSSLGVALFRLVNLSEGSIKIDDLDISSIGLEDLRSKLSIIPQDPVLFVGTVRYNLDPLYQHRDEELWKSLEKCHIKESIAALEQKLDAPVVENGENFSVGERQLLCMARALLRHSKILMLDEATAAIDTETDALVQATLKEAFRDCTMLVIAHRLNTVLSCDKILVMDDGKVVEFDRPSVLMSKSTSAFRTMLEASEGSGLNA